MCEMAENRSGMLLKKPENGGASRGEAPLFSVLYMAGFVGLSIVFICFLIADSFPLW